MRCKWHGRVGAAAVALVTTMAAGGLERLYTPADRSAPGGIRGTVRAPELPIERVLAIPADAPTQVYSGAVVGDDRRSFVFEGLPMRRYDLLVIYEDRFYEGLALHRGPDTLTTEDRAEIARRITESEPFFTRKTVHRLQGSSGRGGLARAICTYLRDRGSLQELEHHRSEHRRTFKLVMLQQVGPGWQIVRARDLYPLFAPPGRDHVEHAHRPVLSRVRVTDFVTDMGELDLTTVRPAARAGGIPAGAAR